MTNTGPSLKNQAGGGSPGSFGVLLPVQAWVRNPSLRSWPTLLFVVLVAVPPVGLVIIDLNGTVGSYLSSIDHVSWLFAAYFAIAWLLLIGVIVRPAQVTRQLLALVVVIALVTQIPLSLALEKDFHVNPNSLSLGSGIFEVGFAEELSKAIPVLVIALLLRKRLSPVDYLFLGAVSGLAFGAREAVGYLTSGVDLPKPGAPELLVFLTVFKYLWRFVTDPISHACWAGITGYFIGLAVSGRYRWYQVGWVGLLIAMILHGLNDWDTWNGTWAWVAVVAVSAILFVSYAKAGVAVAPHTAPAPAAASGAMVPVAAQPSPHPVPAQTPAAPAVGGAWYTQAPGVPPPAQPLPAAPAAAPPPARQPVPEPAGATAAPGPARGGWWQNLTATPLAATAPGQPAAPRSKPWWEE
jgi:RsiW-degrading membrane proteinase PrsW (M82 family)